HLACTVECHPGGSAVLRRAASAPHLRQAEPSPPRFGEAPCTGPGPRNCPPDRDARPHPPVRLHLVPRIEVLRIAGDVGRSQRRLRRAHQVATNGQEKATKAHKTMLPPKPRPRRRAARLISTISTRVTIICRVPKRHRRRSRVMRLRCC